MDGSILKNGMKCSKSQCTINVEKVIAEGLSTRQNPIITRPTQTWKLRGLGGGSKSRGAKNRRGRLKESLLTKELHGIPAFS